MLYVNPQASASFRTHPGMPNSPAREAQALQEFERLFLFQMLKEMRKTIPDGGLFQGGMKQEYFEEMMDDFLAGEMAASGQLGIARQMAAELHAKRPADVPLFHSGIPLPSAPAEGERVPGHHAGIALRESKAGFPMPLAAVQGIPIARAHAMYRLNADTN